MPPKACAKRPLAVVESIAGKFSPLCNLCGELGRSQSETTPVYPWPPSPTTREPVRDVAQWPPQQTYIQGHASPKLLSISTSAKLKNNMFRYLHVRSFMGTFTHAQIYFLYLFLIYPSEFIDGIIVGSQVHKSICNYVLAIKSQMKCSIQRSDLSVKYFWPILQPTYSHK